MTKNSYDLIQALAKCRMRPGSWDFLFIHDLIQKPTDYNLTIAQYNQLKRMATRYRQQLAAQGLMVEIGPKAAA